MCGTRSSAECLGIIEETGTVEPGKRADIVIVKGNASEDIKALHNVDTIIKSGMVIKKAGSTKF